MKLGLGYGLGSYDVETTVRASRGPVRVQEPHPLHPLGSDIFGVDGRTNEEQRGASREFWCLRALAYLTWLGMLMSAVSPRTSIPPTLRVRRVGVAMPARRWPARSRFHLKFPLTEFDLQEYWRTCDRPCLRGNAGLERRLVDVDGPAGLI